MTRRMQGFGRDESGYERTDPWVCGRAASGEPCAAGPDRRGRCLQHEAVDRCRPTRSLRSRRRRLTAGVALLTAGLLAVLLGGGASEALLSPGPLVGAHADVVAGCSDCHAPDGARTAGLFPAPGLDEGATGCGACHAFGHEDARDRAHSLPAAFLPTREGGGARLADAAGASVPDHATFSCAQCHAEHRGADASLTAMADARCQTCHASTFDGFAEGHPEFVGYPHARRRPIAFDHTAHFDDYFLRESDATPSFDAAAPRCTDCHAPEPSGEMMTPRFDDACAACHGDDVAFAPRDAPVFAELPALAEPPAGLATWPTDVGARRLEVPPEMRLLLGDAAADWVALSDRSRRALAWRGLEGEELAHADAIARSLGGLVAEERGDDDALAARLCASSDGTCCDTTARGAELAGALDLPALRDALDDAADAWFAPPQGAGVLPPDVDAPEITGDAHVDAAPPPLPEDATGFLFDPAAEAVVYRPTGHADPVLAAWIELVARRVHHEADALALEDVLRDNALGTVYRRCTGCHNVDRDPVGGLHVHWDGRTPDTLVRFVHRPHLGEPSPRVTDWPEGTCATCHALRPRDEAAPANSFFYGWEGRPTDTSRLAVQFDPIPRERCAECHAPEDEGGRAPTSCLSCHRYHAGGVTHRTPAGR